MADIVEANSVTVCQALLNEVEISLEEAKELIKQYYIEVERGEHHRSSAEYIANEILAKECNRGREFEYKEEPPDGPIILTLLIQRMQPQDTNYGEWKQDVIAILQNAGWSVNIESEEE